MESVTCQNKQQNHSVYSDTVYTFTSSNSWLKIVNILFSVQAASVLPLTDTNLLRKTAFIQAWSAKDSFEHHLMECLKIVMQVSVLLPL